MKRSYHMPNITLANQLTILRILGVPVFILMLLYYTMNLRIGEEKEFQRLIALGLFMLVALTDAVDGFLARARHEVTRLGSILDPIADKALLLSALILLTRPSIPALRPQFPVAFTLLVVSRDAVLVAGATLLNFYSGHVVIRPRWTGKVATVLMMLAITLALLKAPHAGFFGVVCLAAVFTFVSGIQYLYDGIHQFEKEEETSGGR